MGPEQLPVIIELGPYGSAGPHPLEGMAPSWWIEIKNVYNHTQDTIMK